MSGTEGKVVAITDASSGIGEATALLLAERGAKVVLGARRSDRLEALADRIVAAGGEVAYARTDVKQRDDLSNLVKLACERYGKLDVLVNNAGHWASFSPRRPARRGLGGDDRHQHQRCSVRHRRSAACLPPGLTFTAREPGRSVCAHQNPEDHERDKNQVYDVSDGNRPVS